MKKQEKKKAGKSASKEKLLKVFLHNDNVTTMDFVVLVLQSIFDKTRDDAMKIMLEVHNEGISLAGKYDLATAQTKKAAVSMLAKSQRFPLRCSIEGENMTVTHNTKKHDLPKGWIMAGSHPDDYEVGLDQKVCHSGTRAAFMQHAVEQPNGFGTLMQQFSPDNYIGKRLRLRMWIKTEELEGRVQPWMRIDGEGRGQMLGFDNTCDRPINGSTDWQEIILVLNVPEGTTNIAFGTMLFGRGKTWIDDISFEEVDDSVPTTDCPCMRGKRSSKAGPANLNFEDE